MWSRGLTTDDIACKLEISERTVRFHQARKRKTGAANRQEAVAKGIQLGFVSPHM